MRGPGIRNTDHPEHRRTIDLEEEEADALEDDDLLDEDVVLANLASIHRPMPIRGSDRQTRPGYGGGT